MKILKKIVRVLAIMAIMIAAPRMSKEIHESYLYNYKGGAIVKLHAPGKGSGTGFNIKLNGKYYILTNRHVCSINKRGMFAINKQKNFKAVTKIVKIAKRADLCLMKGFRELNTISIASSYKLHETAFTIGHPLGMPLTLEEGKLIEHVIITMTVSCKEDYDYKEELHGLQRLFMGPHVCVRYYKTIQTNAHTFPGNSGSPVLNNFGNLIGVIFAGNRSVEKLGFMVPLSQIKDFLDSVSK